MEKENKKNILADSIRSALDEYGIEYDERFIMEAVKASMHNKEKLRNIFRVSKYWDEKKDAILVPVEFSSVKEEEKIRTILSKSPFWFNNLDGVAKALSLIAKGEPKEAFSFAKEKGLPYKEGQKNTRFLSSLLKDGGQWNDSDKEMQRSFTELCNTLNGLKCTLYISVSPAHLLTISNPSGSSLTSCQSLNSDYEYKAGNSGLLADDVTFVTFVHSGSEYTKKVMRQLYHYKDGVLLQNRLYTSFVRGDYGGTCGRQDESAIIRHAVQEVIAKGEGISNHWNTKNYSNSLGIEIKNHGEGYSDWENSTNDPRVSVLKGYNLHNLVIGSPSICFACGDRFNIDWKTHNGLHCEDCDEDAEGYEICEHCEGRVDEQDIRYVEGYGYICDDCFDECFRYCTHCDEAYHIDDLSRTVNDEYVCEDCRDRYDYVTCSHCGDLVQLDDTVTTKDNEYVCDYCCNHHYTYCDHCGEYVPDNESTEVKDGDNVCDDCIYDHYEQCFDCGEYILKEGAFHTEDDGYPLCEDCHDKRQEEEENATA